MGEVVLQRIGKTYKGSAVEAVGEVSFEVVQSELFGLIGADGAGKTTLFRILTSLILPDQGHATVHGYDVVKQYAQLRKAVGYMPGKFSLYTDLSVEENLTFFASVFNTSVKENYSLIEDIYKHIEPFKDRAAGALSGGMKQKLALCCALIHRPVVLFLDEPTTGIDAVSRKEFWSMLHRLKAQGITILVSTPYMDEAMLCERIALIRSGRIMSVDRPEEIIARFRGALYAIRARHMSRLLKDLRASPMVHSCNAFGEHCHITLAEPEAEARQALMEELSGKTHQAVECNPIRPTIEDCFIQLMQQ